MTVASPINRLGGKKCLLKMLSQYIPAHVTFCEPFAGGAKLLFSKTPSAVEIINDNDGELVNLYRCIKNDEKRSRLIALLNELPYARSVFNSLKASMPEDDVERAARYFFLCRASFAGDVERGGFAVPSTTGRNPVQSFRNAVDSLKAIAGRLRNVCIENLDYAECIRRYDSRESLFYIDCPYFGSEHFYGDSFTEDDHYKLAELLHGIKGMAMVSHYANSLYDDLYRGWHRYEYQSFKGSCKAAIGESKPVTVECLYTNFTPFKTKGLFDAI